MTNDDDSPLQSQSKQGLQIFLVQYQPRNAWFANKPDLK